MKELRDKVAVVTGGTRGIGRAVSLALADAGAKIAILDVCIDETAERFLEELHQNGTEAIAVRASVASYDETVAAFKDILAQFGTVDILVNNAGITRDKLLPMMKPEDFSAVLDVNLVGVYNTIKQVYPVMLKKRAGKIVNVASVAGMMGNAGQANYAASKAGVIGLTKTIAKELAGRGICCNAIAPGFVATSMTTAFADNEDVLRTIPMRRFAKPEEVASLVRFLAGSGSDYITGEVIRIDGGLAM